jgi:hypothetical protein
MGLNNSASLAHGKDSVFGGISIFNSPLDIFIVWVSDFKVFYEIIFALSDYPRFEDYFLRVKINYRLDTCAFESDRNRKHLIIHCAVEPERQLDIETLYGFGYKLDFELGFFVRK